MDVQDTGLSPQRITRHTVSIPSGLVLELLAIAGELSNRARYVRIYNDAQADEIGRCAARIQAIAEQANT